VVVLDVTDRHVCSCGIELVKPRVLLPVGEMAFRHLDVGSNRRFEICATHFDCDSGNRMCAILRAAPQY
jgi:hypothetical protein